MGRIQSKKESIYQSVYKAEKKIIYLSWSVKTPSCKHDNQKTVRVLQNNRGT